VNAAYMDRPPSSRLLLSLAVAAGALLAAGAVFLTRRPIAPLGSPFQPALTVPVMVSILLWALLSLAARRKFVGKLPKAQTFSLPALIWGGSRVAFACSFLILLTCWVISFAFDLEATPTFLQAGVLVLVWMGFTGLIGGAFLNSLLVVRRWRSR
jgi:hypothetical protein